MSSRSQASRSRAARSACGSDWPSRPSRAILRLRGGQGEVSRPLTRRIWRAARRGRARAARGTWLRSGRGRRAGTGPRRSGSPRPAGRCWRRAAPARGASCGCAGAAGVLWSPVTITTSGPSSMTRAISCVELLDALDLAREVAVLAGGIGILVVQKEEVVVGPVLRAAARPAPPSCCPRAGWSCRPGGRGRGTSGTRRSRRRAAGRPRRTCGIGGRRAMPRSVIMLAGCSSARIAAARSMKSRSSAAVRSDAASRATGSSGGTPSRPGSVSSIAAPSPPPRSTSTNR